MEVVLICFAIALVVALWYSRYSSNGTQTRQSQNPETREDVRRHRSETRENVQRRQPFDTATAQPMPVTRELEGSAYVVDGDTLVIQKTQIRLFGVDAPELNHPFGKQAKWALVSLCKGHIVRAEIAAQDDHGRTVARCFLPDGRDLSAEMTRLGLAIDWPKFSGGAYRVHEVPGVRKKLWLATARQKGHMHVWEQFERREAAKRRTNGQGS